MGFLFRSSCLLGWDREPAGGRQSSGSISVPKLYPSGNGGTCPDTTERRQPDPSSPQKDSAFSGLPSLHPKPQPLPFKHISKWMLPFPTSVLAPQSWLSDEVIAPGGTRGKEHICQCRKGKRPGFDSWAGKIPGEGNDNPLQYSCLENPTDGGTWRATARGVAKRQTRLKQLCMHAVSAWQVLIPGWWKTLGQESSQILKTASSPRLGSQESGQQDHKKLDTFTNFCNLNNTLWWTFSNSTRSAESLLCSIRTIGVEFLNLILRSIELGRVGGKGWGKNAGVVWCRKMPDKIILVGRYPGLAHKLNFNTLGYAFFLISSLFLNFSSFTQLSSE